MQLRRLRLLQLQELAVEMEAAKLVMVVAKTRPTADRSMRLYADLKKCWPSADQRAAGAPKSGVHASTSPNENVPTGHGTGSALPSGQNEPGGQALSHRTCPDRGW